jgi:hypothetical protein
MPAGRPVSSPEQRQLRVKGYHMWLDGALDNGKRTSLRAIAMSLGVTVGTVQYWREHDHWDAKVNQALLQHTLKETESASTLANLLRASLYDNMKVLNEIIRDKQSKPIIRIKAISEYADICHKLKVVQPDDLNTIQTQSAVMADFKDDLDGDGRSSGDGKRSEDIPENGQSSRQGDGSREQLPARVDDAGTEEAECVVHGVGPSEIRSDGP